MTDKQYIFDTGSDLGQKHVEYLEKVLDGHTTMVLSSTGIRQGQKCLEIGAGGGSIARWMADRVGPTGHVVAVDIDTEHLQQQPNLDIYAHDIRDGIPAAEPGPYDVIHARQVLMHLPQQKTIFDSLVNALAPGVGWYLATPPTASARSHPPPARPIKSCSTESST